MQWETLRPVNGRHQERLHVGDLVIDAPELHRDYCETAAGDVFVKVPAGRYPVYALRDAGRNWHCLLCVAPGTVDGPNAYRGLKGGEAMEVTITIRQYALAREVLAGTSRVELCPGIEARATDNGSHALYHVTEEL